MDDSRLEELMRAGLRSRAGDADTSAPVLTRALAARRGGRVRGVAVVGLVAASVAAVVVTGSVLGERGPGGQVPPADESGLASEAPGDGGWRTEYWADLQVDVPADWAYGGAPMGEGADRYACFAEAMVSASGGRLAGKSPLPYVGRPIALTDVCQAYPFIGPDAGTPDAPYVWLGAAVEPGTEDLGDGWVQQTVDVNGSTLTVATDDESLRKRILGSARGGETCFSELDVQEPIPGEDVAGGPGAATSLQVCTYRRWDESATTAGLTYAATLGESATSRYVEAIADGGSPRDQCPTVDLVEDEWVLLELRDAAGRLVGRHVVHFVCPGIDPSAEGLSGVRTVELSPEMVRPWAVGGVPAVVYGPSGGKGAMLDAFIGLQG